MVHLSSSSAMFRATLVVISLARFSFAQISNCDAVGCPVDEYSKPRCAVGNTTNARGLGVTSFRTPLSNQSLTWTVLVHSVDEPPNSFSRDFFLGTPPSLNLTDGGASQHQGCALFFDGVTTTAKFPGESPEYDQGTCNDALRSNCVDALRSQVQAELASLRPGSSNNASSAASVCGRLGDALRSNIPRPCRIAVDGRWDEIQVRALTGPTVASPAPRGDCHPTVEKDYNLTLVASHRLTAPSRNSTELASILFGVTPIMTVVYGGNTSEPAIDMTCLKTVGSRANMTIDMPNAAASRTGERSTVLILGLFSLLACIWGVAEVIL